MPTLKKKGGPKKYRARKSSGKKKVCPKKDRTEWGHREIKKSPVKVNILRFFLIFHIVKKGHARAPTPPGGVKRRGSQGIYCAEAWPEKNWRLYGN
jgi:hypothetical protein